jgi:hypothetical protein
MSGKQVERVNSAHVASIGVPIASSLTSGDDGYVLQIRRNQHRTLQNIVASGSYYNNRRYDNILVEIATPPPANSSTAKGSPPGWHKVRVAMALAFVRVPKLGVRRGFGAAEGDAEYALSNTTIACHLSERSTRHSNVCACDGIRTRTMILSVPSFPCPWYAVRCKLFAVMQAWKTR